MLNRIAFIAIICLVVTDVSSAKKKEKVVLLPQEELNKATVYTSISRE